MGEFEEPWPKGREFLLSNDDEAKWECVRQEVLVLSCRRVMSLAMWKAYKNRAETRSIGPKFQTFSRVVHLDLDFTNSTVSLLPLHGFSPSLKSLHVEYGIFPFPRILNLINSFPLFEDLRIAINFGDWIWG